MVDRRNTWFKLWQSEHAYVESTWRWPFNVCLAMNTSYWPTNVAWFTGLNRLNLFVQCWSCALQRRNIRRWNIRFVIEHLIQLHDVIWSKKVANEVYRSSSCTFLRQSLNSSKQNTFMSLQSNGNLSTLWTVSIPNSTLKKNRIKKKKDKEEREEEKEERTGLRKKR